MSLDEGIERAQRSADSNLKMAEICAECEEASAKEHQCREFSDWNYQLVEWLKELKEYRKSGWEIKGAEG